MTGAAATPPPLPAGIPAEPAKGIGLMVLAMALFVVMDTLAKILGQSYAVAQIVWARYTFHFLAMLALVPVLGWRQVVVTREPAHQLLRALLLLCATVFTYLAVRTLPLTDVYAINFTAPLLVTALSVPLLGERVGLRRWIAVLLGLSGALLVIRPGFGTVNEGVVFACGMAVSFALYQVVTRMVSGGDGPYVTLFYASVLGVAASCVALPVVWRWPEPAHWPLMVGLGLIGAAGHLALIQALRRAPASLVSPFSYTQLIWATLVGYALFDHLPDGLTLLGAALVIGAGLFVFVRERQVPRRAGVRRR